ncbi:hypothetical protein GF339_05730 [candidate division KSB3 bacterium]|uniref:Uncharacterized protein n=1 Tax=candidate division KSB3 bacterium TaxID=2044937 RepID=A0A9D5JTZ9_9BACT|nr:hypothetical protein [candidate division KSB3 bacterium]MBD3324064.1 hypothetical protein [candidate division KSB3 bacterium]
MNIPFSIEEFLHVIEQYNTTVWPMQGIFYLLALVMLGLAYKKIRYTDKIISSLLAFFWFWIGIVYHMIFFTEINKLAYAFGILFIIQAQLFFVSNWCKSQVSFHYRKDLYGITGAVFFIYALLIYPLLNYLLGHPYPKMPTFGLPCPTTIFTYGLLLWTDKKIPKYLLVIPLLWSLIGLSAAAQLGIYEDYGLLIAGIVGTGLILFRDMKHGAPEEQPEK